MPCMATAPQAPAQAALQLRGDYARAGSDYRLGQDWDGYTEVEHSTWRTLYARQHALLAGHAAPEVLAGARLLGAHAERIPRLGEASDTLSRLTGWSLVGVPGLIPEREFFAFLSNREFPVTVWMRKPEEMSYLVEPDLFHDFFGHLPMLAHPVFANYVQEYGRLGAASATPQDLRQLARLYWYTVEFGLVQTPAGARAYGAGILSSEGETRYAVHSPRPHRRPFELQTVLASDYRIDAYQHQYFVLDDFEQLFDSVLGSDLGAFGRK